MKYVAQGIVVFLAYIIQTTILPHLKLFGVVPNLILVIVISFALYFRAFDAVVAGIILGVLADVFSGKAFGFNTVMYIIFALACGKLINKFIQLSALTASLVTFLGSVLYSLALYFTFFFLWGEFRILALFNEIILPEALYTMLISIPVLLIIKRLSKRFEQNVKGVIKWKRR